MFPYDILYEVCELEACWFHYLSCLLTCLPRLSPFGLGRGYAHNLFCHPALFSVVYWMIADSQMVYLLNEWSIETSTVHWLHWLPQLYNYWINCWTTHLHLGVCCCIKKKRPSVLFLAWKTMKFQSLCNTLTGWHSSSSITDISRPLPWWTLPRRTTDRHHEDHTSQCSPSV